MKEEEVKEKDDGGGVAPKWRRVGARARQDFLYLDLSDLSDFPDDASLFPPRRSFSSRPAALKVASFLLPRPTPYVSHATVLVGNAHASGTFEKI